MSQNHRVMGWSPPYFSLPLPLPLHPFSLANDLCSKESLENQKKREAIAAKKLRVEEHLEDLQSCYFESCKKHDADDKRDIYIFVSFFSPFSSLFVCENN